MIKINSYEELKNAILNKESIHSTVYSRFSVSHYDVYVEIFGIPDCKYCGVILSRQNFISVKKGFKDCCCTECTNLLKYGVTCTLNISGANEKSKKSILHKYGVVNISKLEEVKQKKKVTNLEKYGFENPAQVDEVKQKKKATNLKKYGFEYYSQSPEYLIKIKNTSLDKYGVDHFTQSVQYKENMSAKIHFNQLKITNFTDYNQEFIENNFIENNKFKMYEATKYFNVGSTILHRRFDIPKRCSIAESEIQELIPNSILNNREFIKPLEIDVLSHDYKLCVEYNGLMWHSSGNARKFPTEYDKNYHLIKTERVEEKGYQLFHIFENEWEDKIKKEIWYSILKNKMNLNTVINTDESIIKITQKDVIKDFILKNSLDSYIDSEINLGLYLGEELYAVICFNKNENNEFKITNTSTKINYNINTLLNKIIAHFYNTYKPSIITYRANRRYYNEYLDFKVDSFNKPEYFYFKSNCHKLYNADESMSIISINNNNELSETQNMYNNGYRKIYDAGYINFKLERN